MYRAPSPFAPENQYHPQPYSPPAGGQIVPGSVTYTTSTGPDGRVIYHPFKAVAASYQTPNGVVSGIQWVPAEATQILPAGAQPATTDFAASWNRGQLNKDEQKALKEWQRDEEKRRRKEEKESRRIREKDLIGQTRTDVDHELRKAREKDAQAAVSRERRKSFNQGAPGAPPGSLAFPTSVGGGNPGYTGYPAYGSTGGAPPYGRSTGVGDLDRQFGDLDLDRSREYGGERDRKISGLGRPRKYSTNESAAERARKISGNFSGDRPGVYNTPGTYPSAPGPYTRPYPSAAGAVNPYPTAGSQYPMSSPGMRPGEAPYAPAATSAYPSSNYPSSPGRGMGGADALVRPTTPYGSVGSASSQGYPRGHILEGQATGPRSRATTPIPGAMGGSSVTFLSGPVPFPQPTIPGASPNLSKQIAFPGEAQLAAPEGFSRPINAAQPYTPFETMKIQDMDDFAEHIPRMPLVLQPHDVYHEDWIRLMQDLSLAWAGRLPVPDITRGGSAPRRATLVADLIDLWNVSFFLPRGIEVVLYKGRERRSGPHAGMVDIQIPAYNDTDSLSSDSPSSDDSDLSGSGERYGSAGYGVYGRQTLGQGQGHMSEVLDARRKRREIKAEKRRRRREKKIRRKAKAKEKKYGLYLTCVPQGGPGGAGAISSMSGSVGGMPGGYGGVGGGYGGLGGGMSSISGSQSGVGGGLGLSTY